jgi:hypothetical protein
MKPTIKKYFYNLFLIIIINIFYNKNFTQQDDNIDLLQQPFDKNIIFLKIIITITILLTLFIIVIFIHKFIKKLPEKPSKHSEFSFIYNDNEDIMNKLFPIKSQLNLTYTPRKLSELLAKLYINNNKQNILEEYMSQLKNINSVIEDYTLFNKYLLNNLFQEKNEDYINDLFYKNIYNILIVNHYLESIINSDKEIESKEFNTILYWFIKILINKNNIQDKKHIGQEDIEKFSNKIINIINNINNFANNESFKIILKKYSRYPTDNQINKFIKEILEIN